MTVNPINEAFYPTTPRSFDHCDPLIFLVLILILLDYLGRFYGMTGCTVALFTPVVLTMTPIPPGSLLKWAMQACGVSRKRSLRESSGSSRRDSFIKRLQHADLSTEMRRIALQA